MCVRRGFQGEMQMHAVPFTVPDMLFRVERHVQLGDTPGITAPRHHLAEDVEGATLLGHLQEIRHVVSKFAGKNEEAE